MRTFIPGMATVRAITSGPDFHWFAYYDKLEFDPDNRYVLAMAVDFEHRAPTAADVIRVGMVDLQDGDRWIELGESRSWGWQQGCMLQWRPNSAHEAMWNDQANGRFVTRIRNIKTGELRTIPFPFYTVSPDGQTAMTLDFERVQDMRPGYGYPGIPDPHADVLAPEAAGIYRLDLESGQRGLVISIADVAAIPFEYADLSAYKHYFNHLLFNPSGDRFVFLHRARPVVDGKAIPSGGFPTRMITAATDGSDLRVVDGHGYTSHFIWQDDEHILAWTKLVDSEFGFFLFGDGDGRVEQVGAQAMAHNGHCTYLPAGGPLGDGWILNDTYPDADHMQQVYLYHPKTDRTLDLGRFYAAPEYSGEWRCDTHPRASRDGRSVIIDSVYGRNGRQMYLIDLTSVERTPS